MNKLICKDGKEHTFDISTDTIECSVCHVTYKEFQDTEKILTDLVTKIVALTNYTNGGDQSLLTKAFFIAMNRSHRTLQQNFFRSLIGFIELMKDMPTDLRNEASVNWCKEVSKLEHYLPVV